MPVKRSVLPLAVLVDLRETDRVLFPALFQRHRLRVSWYSCDLDTVPVLLIP